LVRRLSEDPELVERIDWDKDDTVQRMFTPERLALIAAADADIDAGLGLTPDAASKKLAANREEWLSANQS
jgi:hypothetical protein